ncbi:MAG: aminopeptidase P family protein, partial [Bacteroidales bacterium]|nr:aminopeptidase P family protein [Bacteroidales bacterium]
QQSDLFYLSGIDQEDTILLFAPGHPNLDFREILFVKETNEQITIWEGQKLTKEDASKVSGIKTVHWTKDFDFFLKDLMAWASKVYLNSNEYPKYFNPVPYKDLRFAQELKELFPSHDFDRSAPLMMNLRNIKSDTEIKLIKKAGEITGRAFERVLKTLKPGMKEYHVQAEIEYEFAMNGATGHAYRPIIASGPNACVLHYVDNDKICNDGDLLLMDFGAEYANYAADITRTIPVNGKFTPRQRDCYEAVLRAHDKSIQLLVPGTTIDVFNKEVNKMMEEEMIGLGLFSKNDVEKQDAKKPLYMKYFMHGTSHPLGLDVHDVGSKYEPLQAGMVLTCEPGLYIREENIGIRIENNILVTKEGPVNLTEQIPVLAEEIEALMQK